MEILEKCLITQGHKRWCQSTWDDDILHHSSFRRYYFD